MTSWLFRNETQCQPDLSMERDLSLFEAVRSGTLPGALRIYNWSEPAVTIGYHQKSFAPFDRSLVLPVLRRPTGGGAVLHVDDITFSISAPISTALPSSIAECSGTISQVFAAALSRCGLEATLHGGTHEFSPVCFSRPSPVELVVGAAKVMGLALARKGGFMLAQGVIPLRVDRGLAERVFGPGYLAAARGILDMCPVFNLKSFLDALKESFSSRLGVLFQERPQGYGENRRTDNGNIEPG